LSNLPHTLSLLFHYFFISVWQQPRFTLFPYTTLFRSRDVRNFEVRLDVYQDGFLVNQMRQWDAGLGTLPAVGLENAGAIASLERSEEHTSELQSHLNLVCRLLLEKKKI